MDLTGPQVYDAQKNQPQIQLKVLKEVKGKDYFQVTFSKTNTKIIQCQF